MAPPRKLYKIGEVIKYSGFPRQTIHNYTMMGLIAEAERTEKGHRLYDESVFDRLDAIKRWGRHRPLQEVKDMLEKRFTEGEGSGGKA